MSNRQKLEQILKHQSTQLHESDFQQLLKHAEGIAKLENVVAVVSDLKNGISKIYSGKFGETLGLEGYNQENSIWEKAILELMTEEEREEKYLAELRFIHFLRCLPKNVRSNYYLASKLRMKTPSGQIINTLHRMFYVHCTDSGSVSHALCLYGSLAFDFAGKSFAVNSMTGTVEELTSTGDASILSKREQQVLQLIGNGKTSVEIASLLSISKHTVSRHRQEILAKLQVKNSIEACRIARSIGIIN